MTTLGRTWSKYTPDFRCVNCREDRPPYNAGRCTACRAYFRKHGQERPYGALDGRRLSNRVRDERRREAEHALQWIGEFVLPHVALPIIWPDDVRATLERLGVVA